MMMLRNIKNKILVLIFLLLPFLTNAENKNKVDTIIQMNAYKSFFSYNLKEPLMVTYKLHKGGGTCSRDYYTFNTKSKYILPYNGILLKQNLFNHSNFASDNDYDKRYDKGHLANSEDFANICYLDEETFRYWNCLPQTPALNRGIWKVDETNIRSVSQTDSLLILCGGFYGKKTIGPNKIGVPDSCWKIVYSYTQKKVIFSYIYINTDLPQRSSINYEKLLSLVYKRYQIDIKQYIQ